MSPLMAAAAAHQIANSLAPWSSTAISNKKPAGDPFAPMNDQHTAATSGFLFPHHQGTPGGGASAFFPGLFAAAAAANIHGSSLATLKKQNVDHPAGEEEQLSKTNADHRQRSPLELGTSPDADTTSNIETHVGLAEKKVGLPLYMLNTIVEQITFQIFWIFYFKRFKALLRKPNDGLNTENKHLGTGQPCWKAMSTRGPWKCPRVDVSNNVHLCTHFEISTRLDVVVVHGWTFLRSTRGHRVMSPEWTPQNLKLILKKK